MKPSKLLLTLTAISIIAFVILIFSVNFLVTTAIDKSTQPYKEMINKQIVIEKDTLTVIDYSAIKDEIILNNGKIVALKYAQLNTVK